MKQETSINRMIIFRILILLCVSVLSLTMFYVSTVNTVRENTSQILSNLTELYQNEIDGNLANVGDSLDEIIYRSHFLEEFQKTGSDELYFASMELAEILETKVVSNTGADVYFVLNPSENLKLIRTGSRVNAVQIGEIYDYFEDGQFPDWTSAHQKWRLTDISGKTYFVTYYHFNETYVGALIAVSSLFPADIFMDGKSYLNFALTDENGLCHAVIGREMDLEGKCLWESGTETRQLRKYISEDRELSGSEVKLTGMMEKGNVFGKLNLLQYLIFLLAILSLLLLLRLIFVLRGRVILPINQLVEATKQVGAGNWEKAVKMDAPVRELKELEVAFNRMTGEIKNLKIRSYEDRIERQKITLRALQMQIRPHFFLNALTTIHSMTFKNKNEEIRKFIEALSEYMRYIIRDGISTVTVMEETEKVKKYVEMQSIRFPESVVYIPDILPELEQFPIPQFLILSIVENSLRHAMTFESVLAIFQQVEKTEQNGIEWIHIIVEDNGPGYPQELLSEVKKKSEAGTETSHLKAAGVEAEPSEAEAGKKMPASGDGIIRSVKNGEGIGIRNISNTLKLFYKNSRFEISNGIPHGARTEIWIAADEVAENENTDRG